MATSAVRTHRYVDSRLTELIYRVLLYAAVLLGAIIFAVPFFWMIRTAVMPTWQVFRYPPEWIPAELIWSNFQVPFKTFPFERWFLNSGIIALSSAVGTAISASMVGFSFARLRFPFRES